MALLCNYGPGLHRSGTKDRDPGPSRNCVRSLNLKPIAFNHHFGNAVNELRRKESLLKAQRLTPGDMVPEESSVRLDGGSTWYVACRLPKCSYCLTLIHWQSLSLSAPQHLRRRYVREAYPPRYSCSPRLILIRLRSHCAGPRLIYLPHSPATMSNLRCVLLLEIFECALSKSILLDATTC